MAIIAGHGFPKARQRLLPRRQEPKGASRCRSQHDSLSAKLSRVLISRLHSNDPLLPELVSGNEGLVSLGREERRAVRS